MVPPLVAVLTVVVAASVVVAVVPAGAAPVVVQLVVVVPAVVWPAVPGAVVVALPTVVVVPAVVRPVVPAAVVVVPAAVPLSSLSAFASRRLVVSTGVVVGVIVPTAVAVQVVVPPVVPPVAVVATSHPFSTVVWRPSVDRIHAADYHVRRIARIVVPTTLSRHSSLVLFRQQPPLHNRMASAKRAATKMLFLGHHNCDVIHECEFTRIYN